MLLAPLLMLLAAGLLLAARMAVDNETGWAPTPCDTAAAVDVMKWPSATQSNAEPPPTITEHGYTVHTRGYLRPRQKKWSEQ